MFCLFASEGQLTLSINPFPPGSIKSSDLGSVGKIGKCGLVDRVHICGSRPPPLLKNAALSDSKACELYLQVIEHMRKMYQEARLVHADLSEFNIL